MDLPPLGIIRQFIPLPELLHSVEKGRPFEHCLMCNSNLLEDGTQYLLEKAFKGDEVIFEFALCLDCQQNCSDEMSKKSRLRVDAWFSERVDLADRRTGLLKTSSDEFEPWIDECVLTKKRRSDCSEYQLFAHCDGPDLLFSYFPYMISGAGMDELVRLLSKQTRDRIDGFTDQYLGMPPEFQELPKKSGFPLV